jgi:hypothetical protein
MNRYKSPASFEALSDEAMMTRRALGRIDTQLAEGPSTQRKRLQASGMRHRLRPMSFDSDGCLELIVETYLPWPESLASRDPMSTA